MKIQTILALLLTLITNPAFAEDCYYIENYSNDLNYQKFDVLQKGGKIYECIVAGWCNQGGPYTPGIGHAWYQAWEQLGRCDRGTSNSPISYREFYLGQHYSVGDIVLNHGELFECKIEGWCNGGSAYEPGEGWAWSDAWQPLEDY